MPINWTPEMDAQFLFAILNHQQNLKIDFEKIAHELAAMRGAGACEVTKSALQNRFFKLKNIAKGASSGSSKSDCQTTSKEETPSPESNTGAPKKKRGRPAKNASDAPASATAGTGKKRGRPSKKVKAEKEEASNCEKGEGAESMAGMGVKDENDCVEGLRRIDGVPSKKEDELKEEEIGEEVKEMMEGAGAKEKVLA